MDIKECKHMSFIARVDVMRLGEDAKQFIAHVTIICAECKIPFEYEGLPVGRFTNTAATSADKREARLGIKPSKNISSEKNKIN